MMIRTARRTDRDHNQPVAALLLLVSPGYGKHKKDKELEPAFQYQAGTENLEKAAREIWKCSRMGLT